MAGGMITDAEDWKATLHDGFTHVAFQLDPDARIRIDSFRHDPNGGIVPTHSSTHSATAIDYLADALKRMAAKARGDQ